MKRQTSHLIGYSILALILLMTMACAIEGQIPGNNQDLAATQEALQQTQVALSVEQTLAAMQQGDPVPSAEATGNITVAPEPETTPINPLCDSGILVNFEDVSFCYAPSLASGVNSIIEPQEISEMSENFNSPEHILFEFQGYQLTPTFHEPVIHIYPIQAYTSINPFTQDRINELQTLLSQKPETPNNIPFLPQWNAGQMFSTQKAYIQFANGEGIRFLTQYGQSYWPINNEDLFYTFQGITNDGQYYISAILPISNPELPASGETWPGDLTHLGETYDVYIENMNILLYSQSDDSFAPTLTLLDDMIRSISINQ
ncbi:MAG: hypothetical protein JEZ00_08565 [Anaerolineaceae bacterium]|nr:hypothetical protein [Anaerolineaceae bacterium]